MANPPTYEELIDLALQGKPAPENWRESLDLSGLPLSQRLLIERGGIRSEDARAPAPLVWKHNGIRGAISSSSRAYGATG